MTVNKQSADWMALKKVSLERIETHRQEIESLSVTPDRAQQLRGMIFALREQIETVEPPEAPTLKETTYG